MKLNRWLFATTMAGTLLWSTGGWSADKVEEIEVEGIIQYIPSRPDGIWRVGGYHVITTPTTEFDQDECSIAPGAFAEVEGFFHGAVLVASEIDCEDPFEDD